MQRSHAWGVNRLEIEQRTASRDDGRSQTSTRRRGRDSHRLLALCVSFSLYEFIGLSVYCSAH